ncbi:MAG: substrate-binding domain-containing protein [Chloroflexota bacterium]|nr:substrate-binding domain-containing protein [Chloroflexota bacterium]
MKQLRVLVLLVIAALTALSMPAAAQDTSVLSSMPDLAFPFFVHMQAQIRAEAEVLGVTLLETDGQSSVPKQTADVEAAVVQGVSAIVISPLDVAAMAPALQAAIDAGVPVVTVDRRVDGVPDILAHVGADNVIGGEAQAQWVIANYPDGARIFYLEGQPGSGPAIDRKAGFFAAIEAAGESYEIVFEQTANFRRDEGLSVTEAGLAGLEAPPDVIVAANDDMALGALEAVNAGGMGDSIKIIGFDALPEALESIANGGIDGTVEQFPGEQGRLALQIAVSFAVDGAMPEGRLILLIPVVIDVENLMSAERIGEVPGMEDMMGEGEMMDGMGAAILGDEIAACPADMALTVVGSMPDLAFPFFVHMQSEGRDEAAAIGGVTYVETDGQSSVPKQTADVEAAIVQGANALVISPLDVAAMSPALTQAIEAGLIVVTVDRRVEGVDGILNHVGADNVLGGEAQAQWVIDNYPDGARIFYLEGQPGSGPAIDRKAGFFAAIEAAGETYEIVFEQTANFRRDEGLSVTEAGLAGLETPPDVIIAANDDMALGALEAINAGGMGDSVKIVGFDALPEALQSVIDGGMDGTVEQYPGGQIRTALRIAVLEARGCEYMAPNPVLLTPIVLDASNIESAERIGEVMGS